MLFPAGSDDRLALLLEASAKLDKSLAALAEDEPLARVARLELAGCQRLLGRRERAAELLAGLGAAGIDPSIRLRAQAEQLRLALDEGEPSEVLAQLDRPRSIDGQSTAELDLGRVEALLFLAQDASRRQDAKSAVHLLEQAADGIGLLDKLHAPYWHRRVDQLLIAELPADAASVELLARKADGLYLGDDPDRAIAAYDAAAASATIAGDEAATFELSYKAALVEQRRERHGEAAARFCAIGKSQRAHPQAAATHLLGAWHAGQAAKIDSAAAEAFAAALREHVSLWPMAESVSQARLWLGRLSESRGQWQEAADAYAQVPRSSPHFAAAANWHTQATKRLAKLANENPDDGAIQASYAGLLLAGEDKASLEAAYGQWRMIASRSKPRTARWLEAQYSVALARFKLGDKAGAAALLTGLIKSPPGLAGTGWDAKFAELLKKCSQ
jgi:hypothetical protein